MQGVPLSLYVPGARIRAPHTDDCLFRTLLYEQLRLTKRAPIVYNSNMERHNNKHISAEALASAVGMVCNFLLAAAKIFAGAVTGLLSVLADGVNNLSDCGSSAVALISLRVANKPADKEHPYGHRRAEYIASMCIAFLVLVLAVELARESLEKLLAGTQDAAVWWVYILLGASVLVKAGMFFGYRIVAKRTDCDPLRAAATDSACDCIATLAVLAGALVTQSAPASADGWAGILVALFIGWQGVKLLLEAGSKLLGQAPDAALVERLRAILLAGEGILGIHDLRVYGYGKGVMFATAHAEMDARLPALTSHAVLDGLEKRVQEETGVVMTLHLDPVVVGDEEAKELEGRLRAAVEGTVEGMNIHDFRLVRGTTKKAVFEVGIPFDCPVRDEQVLDDVCRAVRLLGDYEPVVTVERE